MKLAIMQPYFFPYLGYWQLMDAVDRFVIYDDVNFIKRGWINRNRILINGAPHYITVPLEGGSQNKRICDLAIHEAQAWRRKTAKSIECAYSKSPFYSAVYPEIERQIFHDSNNLADFLAANLNSMAKFLGIDTEIVVSSRKYRNSDLSSQDRIIDICQREDASAYVNLPGGQELYDAASFHSANLDLIFLSSRASPYRQRKIDFVPNLSVIDVLMETGVEGVAERLCEYDVAMASAAATEANIAD